MPAKRFERIQRFWFDDSGGIMTVFALSALVLVVLSGVSIDTWRMLQTRDKLQIAADSAVIAVAREAPETLSVAQAIAENIFSSNFRRDGASVVVSKPTSESYQVLVSFPEYTTIMKVAGYWSMNVSVSSRAVSSVAGGPLEVALVLDNTGSMAADMSTLKTTASDMVNSLYTAAAGNPNFKMSVVPFVAAVNPGRTILEVNAMEALDVEAKSEYHGKIIRDNSIAIAYGCVPVDSGSSGGSTDPGTGGNGAFYWKFLKPARKIANELFGIKPAYAADVTPNTLLPLSGALSPSGQFVPTGFVFRSAADSSDGCAQLRTPTKVSHIDLFNRLPKVTASGAAWGGWKGCVEARPAPYDVTDDPPASGNADTLFVPYFYPDETDPWDPDWPPFANNYMPDGYESGGVLNLDPTNNPLGLALAQTWTMDDSKGKRLSNILKYNGVIKANIDETAPDTKGPNKNCPDEILPLTSDKTAVLNKIASLSHWNGGGTIIPVGLVWGWRTLSPNKPYANGLALFRG